MKTAKLLFVVGCSALILAGCGFGKMVPRYPEVKVTLNDPANLETKGGKVSYNVQGTIPPKYLKKRATMTFTPTVEYEGGVLKLNPVTVQGEKAKATGPVIPYKTGGSFSTSGSFDYKDEYEEAVVYSNATANKKKKSQDFPKVKMGEGISNTASRVGMMPTLSEAGDAGNGTYLLYGPHGYKAEYMTQTGVIYFPVNNADVNWNLNLNKDKAAKENNEKFVNFLNEGRVIDKVVVTGWASPEGEESMNDNLSQKRSEQGKKWFDQQYEKYMRDYAKKNKIKYKDLPKPELVYNVTASGEDWSGFETAVEKSSIAEKNQILNVVRSQSTPAMREQKIREMTDIYNEIKDAILPPLRRVEVGLVCNKNNFNDQQIAEKINSNPSELSLNERLYAASMEKDLDKKMDIYKAIADEKDYQTDWRAYNNMAALQLNEFLNTGDVRLLNDANDNLEKAAAVSPNNGIILNNQAVLAVLKGDVQGAKEKLEASQKASVNPVNQNYNLAMYKILDGDYDGAQQMMNNRNCDYNMALSHLLKQDYAACKKGLECIENKDAQCYYLMAVLSARTNNEAEVYTNLKKAVEMNAGYKTKAAKDAEFKQYKKSPTFQEIVK
ncbi:MAG: hypothetical protein IKR71_07640 [Bacteroidales bacterium]|nr:hypothetical protein [Bacteroidales bacterium]